MTPRQRDPGGGGPATGGVEGPGHERFAVADAAYLLGALDPEDRAEFEEHLRGCPACARSVAELAGVPGLLRLVPRDAAEGLAEDPAPAADPPPGLLDAVMARARREGARQRRRLVAVPLAAASVLVAGVVAVGTVGTAGDRDAAGPPPPAAAPVEDGQVVALAGDPTVALAAEASLRSVPWGTAIELRCRYDGAAARQYAAPPAYALVLVLADGSTEHVGSWRAVPGREITLDLATAEPVTGIDRLEVRTAAGEVLLSAAT